MIDAPLLLTVVPVEEGMFVGSVVVLPTRVELIELIRGPRVMFTGYVYLYGLIYGPISGLLYESTLGLAWGPHYAYYFTFYLLIDTS